MQVLQIAPYQRGVWRFHSTCARWRLRLPNRLPYVTRSSEVEQTITGMPQSLGTFARPGSHTSVIHMHLEVSDEVYARIRDLLAHSPELFAATRAGLTLTVAAIDEHVIGDDITRSMALAAGLRDRWLLRATRETWVLLPGAFGVDDELPAFVQDQRGERVGRLNSGWDCFA